MKKVIDNRDKNNRSMFEKQGFGFGSNGIVKGLGSQENEDIPIMIGGKDIIAKN